MFLLELVLAMMALAAQHDGLIVSAAHHGGGSGAVRFANSLGSSMVLQQAPASAQVYGEGPAGQKLQVTLQHNSAGGSVATAAASVSVTIGPDGRWVAKLPPVAAAIPFSDSVEAYTVTAKSGQSSAVLEDVVFGDVIVCGGQVRVHPPTLLWPNSPQASDCRARLHYYLRHLRSRTCSSASATRPMRPPRLPQQMPSASRSG
jgi:hypothetical protein